MDINKTKISVMATVKNFEELKIWNLSRQITRMVYEDFCQIKDFGFKDQIQRCSVSIMNNIAEGFCRNTDAEFRQFLNISKGSCGELKSMYYIAEDLDYLPPDLAAKRRNFIQEIINGTSRFMKYLKSGKS
jgi:four helix bundle protein